MLIIYRNVGLTCSEAWLQKFGNDELSHALNTDNQLKKCLPRCERQTLTPTFTFSKFPLKAAFSQHQDFCLALNKVSRICSNPIRAKVFENAAEHNGTSCKDVLNANNTLKFCTDGGIPNATTIKMNPKMSDFLFKYAESNFADLRVYIKDPYYTSIKCDEQMSLISYLGNAGGLLGTSLGLSLVSIFEIFYHTITFFTENNSRKVFNK